MNNVVEATILTGPFIGEDVLILRIPMIPTDTPFQFKRLQFPIRLAFAITINKAQGQSLELYGLDLDADCFSHGQHCMLRVPESANQIFIYADWKNKKYYISTSIAKLNFMKCILCFVPHFSTIQSQCTTAKRGRVQLVYYM
ncbi:unnamed protein product [Chilo suppressalis]|uniref:ATP-dependent DNA helicase n=1 Tax=Chilo suppressalis TaxID=168631 RepID=A0ABN8AYG2_CHISP|nr:unnamed protein product [Chilo suppressalis]